MEEMQTGFAYVAPIEIAPTAPIGKDLMVIPCLFACWGEQRKHGIGRALVAAAEEEARRQGRKGIVTIAHYHDFWFMPAAFFERLGYAPVAREGTAAIMWKLFDNSAEPPRFLKPAWQYEPIPGKVVVDLFWMTFCGASDEADVLNGVAGFENKVVVRSRCVDDPQTLRRHQICRAFYVNGAKVEWDHEDGPRGVRLAVLHALEASLPPHSRNP